MARLYEYQGKELLEKFGIPIPRGGTVSTAEGARRIAESIGRPVAIKAQVWTTGRMKAGGIKFAETPEEAENMAKDLIGSKIKGLKIEKLRVEEKLDPENQYYAGIIIDSSYKVRGPVIIFTTEGGIEIEEIAEKYPEKIVRMNVNIFSEPKLREVSDLLSKFKLEAHILRQVSDVICKLYNVFREYDVRVIEINPLILTKDGGIHAADCHISIDDSSVMRHPELGIAIPREMSRPPTELEKIAWRIEEDDYRGVCYFAQLATQIDDPNYIGFHGIGGGGAMKAAQALINAGLKLASYADTSGNPPASKVYRCAKVILSQPRIKGYILAGATIANQEQWHHAHGLVKAIREDLKDRKDFPVIILIAGNKEEESHQIVKGGLEDLPVHLEVYGREYVNKMDYIAERMKSLVEEYKAKKEEAG